MRRFRRKVLRSLAAVLPLAILLGVAGCGGGVGSVSGKVLLKGEPLKGGNVTFARDDGKQTVSTAIGEDGSYSFPRVPVGSVKICVETESLNPAKAGGGIPNRPGARPPGGAGQPPREYKPPPGAQQPEGGYTPSGMPDLSKRYKKIPDKYAQPTTTDLTYEVKTGSHEYTIQLNP